VPQDEWVQFGPALVLHGRYVCTSANPNCRECIFNDLCPKIGVETTTTSPQTKTAATVPALAEGLPDDWRAVLADEFSKPYFRKLSEFVAKEHSEHTIFPLAQDIFNAFKHTPFDRVKVVLLGQDPYHDDGQAHGLCFSVQPGVKPPPSLVNIFKELHDDL